MTYHPHGADDPQISRRSFLLANACGTAPLWQALESVASFSLAHAHLDMAEKKTWQEWVEEGR